MKLSIVVPCYNEPGTIGEIVRRVLTVQLPAGMDREILIVDDGSRNETREAIARAAESSSSVQVITRQTNGGKGRAVKDGLAATTGDYVVIQDADLEYDPTDYARLLAPLLAGEATAVFGSRNLSDNNSSGRAMYFWGGQLVTWCFNISFRTHLSDLTTCYKMFSSAEIPALLAQPSDDFVFDAIELSWVLTRGKVIELPIRYAARSAAEGKKLRAIHGVRCIERLIELRFGATFFRVGKFIIVGGLAMLINLAVLYVLISMLGIWYLASSIVSFLVALMANFFLQKVWAFGSRRDKPYRQFAAFFGTNIFNLGLNTLIMYLLVSHVGIEYLIAQIITSVLISIESFFAYSVIFKKATHI
jgi:dolichol-phosphate mannosyltransferase